MLSKVLLFITGTTIFNNGNKTHDFDDKILLNISLIKIFWYKINLVAVVEFKLSPNQISERK